MSDILLRNEWFEAEQSEDVSQKLWSRFSSIRQRNQLRTEIDRFYCSLYYDRAYQGFNSGYHADLFLDGLQGRLQENVIARIVQSLAAKFARQKPKPTVLTDGADWSLQQRAKKYDKYIWGIMHDARVYELQRMSDLHMLICGTGVIYCGSRNGKVYCEHVPPWELFVDTSEARYGTPRTIYRCQHIDRRFLLKLYSDKRDAIEGATNSPLEDSFNITGSDDSDMVAVVTGWRLPSGPDAGDGKVVVTTNKGELDSSDWDRERFPFAVCRYSLAPEGFWGIGAVVGLVGMQIELNRTLLARQEALMRMGAPHLIVEKGTVTLAHLNNKLATIWEVSSGAMPPQVFAPNVISPEAFQHGDRVKSGMFQNSGLSEMAAAGMKPAGLNSGKALRAYADMTDDSLHDAFVRREQQILDLAELILDEAESLEESKDADKASTLYVGPFGIEKIDFSEARMDRKSFVLQVQPTSSLSTTLAGRLEDLMDLKELGIITDPSEMQELLQLPDLNTAASRRNAMRDLLFQVLEDKILDEGISVTPEPRWDLQLALKMAVFTRLRAQLHNAPEDRIQLLTEFETKCISYLNGDAANDQQPAQQPPMPPPPGEELPPPQALPQTGSEVPPEMAPAPAPAGAPPPQTVAA